MERKNPLTCTRQYYRKIQKIVRSSRLLRIVFVVLLCVFLVWTFLPIFHTRDASSLPGHIRIVDRHGFLMTDMSLPHGYSLPLQEKNTSELLDIPFIIYLLQIEDKRFLSHLGVDAIAKTRAITNNLFLGRVTSGASTLTEQWIKNTYFSTAPRTIIQKIREGVLAIFFTLTNDKESILEKYLNSVYFGNQIYGIQAAVETYFDKSDLNDLNEEEIVHLLTLLHNPSLDIDDSAYKRYFQSTKERLGFTFQDTIVQLPGHENFNLFPFVSQKIDTVCHRESQSEYFIFFSNYDCDTGDFTSTIDAQLSLFARDTMRYHIEGLLAKKVTNGAIFAVHPLTKEILIYEGSKDFYSRAIDGQVNVIDAPRQPGSTMKPFLYLMALERGFDPDDLIFDLNREYPSFQPGTTYTSENYSLKEYGLVRMKKALGNSLNNASVRLAESLGLQEVYDFYLSSGFQLDHPPEYYGYSLVLGNPSITLHDLVKNYTLLIPQPGKDGEVDAEKFLLMDMLRDPDNRDISFGVDSLLNTSILQAVKTGTSSNFRDNTLVSYSPDMVIGMWFGNNDNSPMIGVTGITGAGYVWHQIAEEAIKRGYIQDRQIQLSPSIELVPYCLDISCYQRENIYQKKGTQYFSRILDGFYDRRDIPEVFTDEDISSLSDLGFSLR